MGTTTDEHDDRGGHSHDHECECEGEVAATDDAAAVTDRVHDTSWSANLEKPEHAADRSLVVDGAVHAVEHTAPGNHVNLVTHGEHGHPADYLYGALAAATWDGDVTWEYVEQCGCGGHVTRVYVR